LIRSFTAISDED